MRISEVHASVVTESNQRPLRTEQNQRESVRATAHPDGVRGSDPLNPYQGVADRAVHVKVDRWKQGDNDSIERILLNQGYKLEDIYRRDTDGKHLISRVAEANGLPDPNLIRAGSKLLVPTRQEEPAVAPQPEPNPEPVAPPPEEPVAEAPEVPVQQETPDRPAPAGEETMVTVDRWRQGPNDSLEAILKNQGYEPREIYRKDSQGKTLIDRVGERNLPRATIFESQPALDI